MPCARLEVSARARDAAQGPRRPDPSANRAACEPCAGAAAGDAAQTPESLRGGGDDTGAVGRRAGHRLREGSRAASEELGSGSGV